MKKSFISTMLLSFTLLSFPIAHAQNLSDSNFKPNRFTILYDTDIANKYKKEKQLKKNNKLCNFRVTISSINNSFLTKPIIEQDIGCQKDFIIQYRNESINLKEGDITIARIKYKQKSLTDDKAIFTVLTDSFIVSKYDYAVSEKVWQPDFIASKENSSLIFSNIGFKVVGSLVKNDKNLNSLRNTKISIIYME